MRLRARAARPDTIGERAPVSRFLPAVAAIAILITGASPALAIQIPAARSRLADLAISDPSAAVAPEVVPMDDPRVPAPVRAAWSSFTGGADGKGWDVYLDARSGAPLLVQGHGIPFLTESGSTLSPAPVTVDSLAVMLRTFVANHEALLLADENELVLNLEGSGQVTPDLWQVTLDRAVAGIPVLGDRYVFYIGHGNLIAFGATRWTSVAPRQSPRISREEALALLRARLDLGGYGAGAVNELYDAGTLVHVPMAAPGSEVDSFAGVLGTGYRAALAWRISLAIEGTPGVWEALIDASSGAILSLNDLGRYARVKGGVLPASNDGSCPSGCEQASYPMPRADVTIGANTQTAGSMGTFTCAPGGSPALTRLAGDYVRIADTCGPIAVSATCDNDIDLMSSGGTDCAVPPGASPGDTRSSRTAFYHLNRIKEHVRAWLPSNTWITQQLTSNVNIPDVCNAFWNGGGAGGTVNFYRSGGGCRNSGEIAAIVLHEWGHGLDQNDGGGNDNPGEAYADITAFMLTHSSCMSRGFYTTNCTGYGNACLSCTGYRDSDWDQRANHAPQTPDNWPSACPLGGPNGGPCGKEPHCEAALTAETLWDLAVRDLPASGIDQPTAWQIVDRLWFRSRLGSGGNAYGCGTPASNRSCGPATWFTKLRTIDDDDGNLANGTPHAAQVFSAFNRHGIPCGAATDATNRNTSSCPALMAPTVTATPASGQVALSWTAVPNAAIYNVLRNDQGCGWGYTIVATVSGTTYTDTGLVDYFPLYYAIQPVGTNSACTGRLSACLAASAGGPHASYSSNARVADTCGAGGTGNGDGIYDAGELIQFSVTIRNDGNFPLTGVTATVTATTPGVTMVVATASYPNLAVGATGTSVAPHFKAQLPASLACGAPITYSVAIHANEGTWTQSLSQTAGQPVTIGGTVLSESFAGGIPASWEVSDGGDGGGAAATWTTANPGGRTFTPPIAPPAAIVDSFYAGSLATQDELLITPLLDLSAASSVTLAYDEYFRRSSDEIADVDLVSTRTGGQLTNVVHLTGSSTANPDHRVVDITAQAAGAPDVQIWFHYWNGQNDLYWQVDNVTVTWSGTGSCNMHLCAAAVCGDSAIEPGEQCDDGNTVSGDCCSAACQYEAAGSPCGSGASASCTAPDTCSAAGQCQANNAPNGTSCSDGNPCTQPDACQSGACTGVPVGPLPEIAGQRFSSRTRMEWNAAATSGPAPVYDVIRGLQASFPVGTGGELCRAAGLASLLLDDTGQPAAGSLFWYLVRARNSCGAGTYGAATGGAPRISSACP